MPIADYWMFIDNSKTPFEILAEGQRKAERVKNKSIRNRVLKGLNKTYKKLLEMKRRTNSVLVISENG